MSATPFFPDLIFGWVFYLVLVAITLVASYFDFQRMIIPKVLAVFTLITGILFNVVRGAWLGIEGWPGPYLGLSGAGWGAVDGVLFALAGFAVGFGMFFLMWLLGTCGGGDVKLFGGLGAWLGPLWTVYILIGSWFVVMIAFVGWGIVVRTLSGLKARPKKVAYSFPVALSTAVVLLWVFRAELQLKPTIDRQASVRTVTPR